METRNEYLEVFTNQGPGIIKLPEGVHVEAQQVEASATRQRVISDPPLTRVLYFEQTAGEA